jgi:abortive infection bacteriophage resistance protein
MRTKVGHLIYSRSNVGMNPEKDKPTGKLPTTYKEQVELFRNKNLYVENSENTEKSLQRINYYCLSAYGLTLKFK